MGVGAIIENGVITNASATVSDSTKANTLNKDDFLQLLVAQMKYQDPLEPTSNTEYISQYATFSEVEQMQNMSQNMDLSRASALVGQTVQVTSTDDSGKETTVMGKVDYVKYENGKAMVSIDEALYSLSDVSYVCDKTYLDAYEKGKAFVTAYAKLPEVEKVSLTDKETIEKLVKELEEMNDYEKTFIAKSVQDGLKLYREKLQEVVKNAEQTADKNNSSEEENSK